MIGLSKESRLPQNIIHKLYILLFFLTPLLLSPISFEVFEFPKMLFVYLLTTFIVTLWIIRQIKEGRIIFQKTFLDLPLVLFLISQVISTIISTDRHTSIFGYYSRFHGGLLSTIAYSLLYWALVSNIDYKKRKSIIINSSLASAFLISIYAILQHFGVDKHIWIQDVQSRVFSTLGQPNWLAAYLSVLIPFSLLPLLNSLEKKKKSKILLYSTLLLAYTFALLFTKSKSGFIAFIFSISIFLFFYLLKFLKQKSLRKKLRSPIILSISFFFIFLLIGTPYTSSLKNLFNKAPPPEIQTQPGEMPLNITRSEDIRLIVWKGAIDLWKKYPLFGTGTETFAYSYYWVRPKEHNLTSEWDFLYNKAHNEYLNFLATTGTIGLLAYLSIPLALLLKIIKKPTLENLALSVAYSTILITNFFGFSVVIIGLYFFILPSLISQDKVQALHQTNRGPNGMKKDILLLLTILLSLKTAFTIINYYRADYHFNQSKKFRQMGQNQESVTHIEKAIRLFPFEPNYYSEASAIYSQIAFLYFQEGATDKTKEYIELTLDNSNQTIKISPTHPNLLKSRARVLYTLTSIDPGYTKSLIVTMETTARLAPTDAKTLYNLALIYQSDGQEEKTIETLLKTIDLKENYDQAHFTLAEIYESRKNFEKAQEHYQKIEKLKNL